MAAALATWPGFHFGALHQSAGTVACQTHLGHPKMPISDLHMQLQAWHR